MGALAVALALLPAPLGAQQVVERPPATAGPSLRLTALTGVTGPGSVTGDPPPAPPAEVEVRVAVDHAGAVPVDNLRVVVEAHGAVSSRSELHHQLDGGNTGGPRLIETHELRGGEALEPGAIAGATIHLPVDRVAAGGRGGVYPVEISLVRGTDVLDRLVTAVIHLADAPVAPLQTVAVWPLDGPLWRTVGGQHPARADGAILPGRRLERLLTAVEQRPDAPVVLAPAAHVVEALADRADGFTERVTTDQGPESRLVPADHPVAERSGRFLERIRELVGQLRYAPVTGPYADADVAGLAGGRPSLAPDAGIAASEGRRRLLALTGRQVDPATSLATVPLTPAALDVVPGDHVLLSYDQIDGPDLANDPDLPPAVRTLAAASGRRLTATVADPYLEDLLADAGAAPHGPLAVTQRVLVETAMIHFERPSETGRPLLLLPPPSWDPHPRVPSALLSGLVGAPWLSLVDPATQLAAVGGGGPTASLARRDAALPQQLADALVAAKADLSALVDALPDPQGPIDGRRAARLTDQLLRATSTWLAGDPIEALQLVRDVQGAVDETFGHVEVPTTAQVTLTSERGTIPVTLRRPTGGALEVRVEVEAPGALSWEGQHGAVQTFELGGAGATQTVSFEAFARSRGLIPVTVTVTDPSGQRVLAEERLTVRSTAISGPALLVLGTVVVALLAVGEWRRRRPGRPDLTVVPDDDGAVTSTTRRGRRRRYARPDPGGG